MDVAALIQILAPALPFLVKVGDKAFDGAIAKMGEDSWDKAKGLWNKLSPKVESDPIVKNAAENVAADPENADRQTVLKIALGDLLVKYPDLVAELVKLMETDSPNGGQVQKQVSQNVGSLDRGSKAVASIDNVKGNVTL